MSTQSVLAELRRKKQCIERAIRALEQLQQLEEGGLDGDSPEASRRSGSSKVIVLRR